MHIMASHVNNLTDARYFASWGTDYIGFCRDFQHIDYCNDDRIKEMTQWLEGPDYLLEFSTTKDEETILSMQQVTGISNVRVASSLPDLLAEDSDFLNNNYWASEILFSSAGKKYPAITLPVEISLITQKTWDILNKFSAKQPFFLEINWKNADDIYTLTEKLWPFGLIFQGSDEEKTGMKSYDILDNLFDAIQNLNE